MKSIHGIRLLTLGLLVAISFVAAACGGGPLPPAPPPPTGPFSVANLNGQYAFVTNGELFNGNVASFARTGSFTADGKGNITGGVEDANTLGLGDGPALITGGSYTVSPDGRGTLMLMVNNSTIQFSIALTSSNDGLMVDFTNNTNQISTGSGNFFKQNPAAFLLSGISGNYAFDFSGIYPDGNQLPSSIIGQFTSNGTGSISGIEDADVGGVLDFGQPAPVSIANTSMYSMDLNNTLTTFGRGVATFNDGNLNPSFVFYIVDSTRVRFLSTQPAGLLIGDAVKQSANLPVNTSNFNSGFVFALGGANLPNVGPLSRLGRFTATAGTTGTSVLVDTNELTNGGSIVNTQTNTANAGTITIDPLGTGRGTITFKDPNMSAAYKFIFYLSSPTSGVIQDVSGPGIVADGSLTAQTGGPFSGTNITGTYAFNWSGQSIQTSNNVLDEEDAIGQVTISMLSLKGAADTNQFSGGGLVGDVVSGTVTLAGDGTGGDGSMPSTMSITLTQNGSTKVNFVSYVISPDVILFASTDNKRIVIGILKRQPVNP